MSARSFARGTEAIRRILKYHGTPCVGCVARAPGKWSNRRRGRRRQLLATNVGFYRRVEGARVDGHRGMILGSGRAMGGRQVVELNQPKNSDRNVPGGRLLIIDIQKPKF